MQNTLKVTAALVIASIGKPADAYVPTVRPKPSVEVVNKYISTSTRRWHIAASNNRKQELLNQITNTRAAIRKQLLKSQESTLDQRCENLVLIATDKLRTKAARNRDNWDNLTNKPLVLNFERI